MEVQTAKGKRYSRWRKSVLMFASGGSGVVWCNSPNCLCLRCRMSILKNSCPPMDNQSKRKYNKNIKNKMPGGSGPFFGREL